MNGRSLIWILIIIGIVVVVILFTKSTKNIATNNQEVAIEFVKSSEVIPNMETTKQIVLKTEDEWRNTVGTPSTIDFTKNTALLVCMGKRMTGGYSIEILSIIQKENKIHVAVDMISPGKYCITTQAITYPSETILIPKTDKEIIWTVTNTTKDCPQ